MATFIKAIAYYLPEKILSNEDIHNEHPEWSVDKISGKTGIFRRHIADQKEYASDMAVNAAKKLLSEYQISPGNIDFVLYCTQSPDYFLPTTACIIQDKLNVPTSAGALDFNLGCSGYVYGLALAKGLVETSQAQNVLLITSETYSKFIHPKDKSNKTIFGDAASATLVTSEEGIFEIKNFSFGTDGKGAKNLIVRNGGIRHRFDHGVDQLDGEGNFYKNDDYLFMNGSEIFNFTSKAVPELVNDVLSKNGLTLQNIDFFLFHQANKYMLEYVRKKIGIPLEKFIYYLEDVGNTVSCTLPIGLKESVLKLNIEGRYFLLAGFGVVYSWAGCIIEKII